MRPRSSAIAAVCAGALLASGCLGGGDDDTAGDRAQTERPAAGGAGEEPGRSTDDPPRTGRLEPARCPPDLSNCRTARGRIVYVERVDPDGDGDAHFVLSSPEAITLPGLTVIDVKKSLRPHPLPGPGDRISAAGPVYRGSYGQKQIEAIELHVARAR